MANDELRERNRDKLLEKMVFELQRSNDALERIELLLRGANRVQQGRPVQVVPRERTPERPEQPEVPEIPGFMRN